MILRRTGIDGWFQKVVLKRVGQRTLYVANHAGDDADDAVCHNCGSQFSACKDIVADAHLLRDEVFADAVVDAFVVAANDDDILLQAQVVRHRLVELLAVGGSEYHLVIMSLSLQRRDTRIQRLTLYHHTGLAAVGIVIDAAPFVGGIVAQIMDVYLCQALTLGTSQNACRDKALKHLRQYGYNIYSHFYSIEN